MRTVLHRAVVVAVALVAASCGGGGGATTTAATQPSQSSSAPTTTTSSAPSTTAAGGSGFSDLLSEATNASYRVTYQSTDASGTSTLTISQQPPKVAMIASDGRVILTGKEMIVCTTQGTAVCFTMPSSDTASNPLMAVATPFLAFQQLETMGGLGGVSTSSKTIAGRAAECASLDASKILGSSDTGSATVCVDAKTGILLSWEGTDSSGATQSMVATEVGSPQPDDFTPPVTPQPLPGS